MQAAIVISFQKRLKILYPRTSHKKQKTLLIKFSGGLVKKVSRLDTHRNGGAFYLTIVDRRGNDLFMGTDHDDLTARAATTYFENKRNRTPLERAAELRGGKPPRFRGRALTAASVQ